ncbi:hypothetical protein M758_UG265300 [Ceratodon purpureus]|nr:hypothetical protein M758_UG265300 [Ceratodon purpureus]KAG0596557.1 hypothetical protein M758_UG265300 [Ceratodon purpureus]KAG0596560.1 hypothetical protein M758_UG265300 [Ceratodon purpureus]
MPPRTVNKERRGPESWNPKKKKNPAVDFQKADEVISGMLLILVPSTPSPLALMQPRLSRTRFLHYLLPNAVRKRIRHLYMLQQLLRDPIPKTEAPILPRFHAHL